MRRFVILKITYDTYRASKQGIINVISEIGAVIEVEEVRR